MGDNLGEMSEMGGRGGGRMKETRGGVGAEGVIVSEWCMKEEGGGGDESEWCVGRKKEESGEGGEEK